VSKRKFNQDQPGNQYAYIPKSVYESEAFRSLSKGAMYLLIQVCGKYRKPRQKAALSNNGNLEIPYTRYRALGFGSRRSMERAIKELLAKGLLTLTRQGGRTSVRVCNLYALGWLPIPHNPSFPDLDIALPQPALDGWRTWDSTENGKSPSTKMSGVFPRDCRNTVHETVETNPFTVHETVETTVHETVEPLMTLPPEGHPVVGDSGAEVVE
jgi:hypothetical protein